MQQPDGVELGLLAGFRLLALAYLVALVEQLDLLHLLERLAERGGINVVTTTAIATLIKLYDSAGGTAPIGPLRGSRVLQKATRRWTLDAGFDERPCAALPIGPAGFPARLGVADIQAGEIIARPIGI